MFLHVLVEFFNHETWFLANVLRLSSMEGKAGINKVLFTECFLYPSKLQICDKAVSLTLRFLVLLLETLPKPRWRVTDHGCHSSELRFELWQQEIYKLHSNGLRIISVEWALIYSGVWCTPPSPWCERKEQGRSRCVGQSSGLPQKSSSDPQILGCPHLRSF